MKSRLIIGAGHALPLLLLLIGCAAATPTATDPTDEPTQPLPTETAAPADTREPTVAAPPTETPLPTPEPEPLFEFHGGTQYITRGGGWEGDFAFPMSIIEVNDQFYFYRTSSTGQDEKTGYAVSADLAEWTHPEGNPLITSAALPDAGASYMLLPWSITPLLEGGDPESRFAMYFWSWTRASSGDSYIGRITAPAPEGPYTLDPRRLFEPNRDEGWDRTYIQSPTVLINPDGDGYVMLYQGSPSISNLAAQGFGWATSPDGVDWTRHGDPVLLRGESAAWDDRNIQQPHMVHTPDGYVMVYEGGSQSNNSACREFSCYGIAYSADGITWVRHPANPIFTPDDFPRAGFTHVSSLFYHDGTYYLLLELGAGSFQSTEIWLATYEGSLVP